MEDDRAHDLTAAYALDALDAGEREAFEGHLAQCERCRDEVAELSSTAAALAFGVESVVPPAALRGRILAAARAERPNVVAFRPRSTRVLAAVAAVAACVAVGLGIWNISLHDDLRTAHSEALQHVAVSGASGSLVVSSGQTAALVLSDLPAAPDGKTYEAWVLDQGTATAAGLFHGGHGMTYVSLGRRVPKGATVGVTIEPAGGSSQPTTKPLIVSQTV
jgi:anti-sigma-K factor RskA